MWTADINVTSLVPGKAWINISSTCNVEHFAVNVRYMSPQHNTGFTQFNVIANVSRDSKRWIYILIYIRQYFLFFWDNLILLFSKAGKYKKMLKDKYISWCSH